MRLYKIQYEKKKIDIVGGIDIHNMYTFCMYIYFESILFICFVNYVYFKKIKNHIQINYTQIMLF